VALFTSSLLILNLTVVVTLHMTFKNVEGNNVTCWFEVKLEISTIQGVLNEIFHHVGCNTVGKDLLPTIGFLYNTIWDKVKMKYSFEQGMDWDKLKCEVTEEHRKKGIAEGTVFLPTKVCHGFLIILFHHSFCPSAHS
jgi:hypothetical protein